MDVSLFYKLNNLIGLSTLFDDLIIFFASPFVYLTLLVVFFAFIFPGYFVEETKGKILRVGIVFGVFAGLVARFVVKEAVVLFHDSPRPFDILEVVSPLIAQSPMNSFPSGHALFFFALSAIILFYSRGLGVFLLIASTLIAISRVIAGVHWPSDILAGASIGILTGVSVYSVLVTYVLSRLRERRKMEME